ACRRACVRDRHFRGADRPARPRRRASARRRGGRGSDRAAWRRIAGCGGRYRPRAGERGWAELRGPLYFYGHGEKPTLADIRAGRAALSVGGPDLHPTAGAVSIGARRALVAFNVILYDIDLVGARALARSIRESAAGLRGVQALAFELP